MPSSELSGFLEAYRAGAVEWRGRPGAAPADIDKLRSLIPGAPEAYLTFLARMDGGDGALSTEAPITYVRLWSVAWSIQANNDYEVHRWLPHHWGIGDNGGPEMLVFDRSAPGWPLYAVPFAPMEAAARIPVAPSFTEALRRLGKRATG